MLVIRVLKFSEVIYCIIEATMSSAASLSEFGDDRYLKPFEADHKHAQSDSGQGTKRELPNGGIPWFSSASSTIIARCWSALSPIKRKLSHIAPWKFVKIFLITLSTYTAAFIVPGIFIRSVVPLKQIPSYTVTVPSRKGWTSWIMGRFLGTNACNHTHTHRLSEKTPYLDSSVKNTDLYSSCQLTLAIEHSNRCAEWTQAKETLPKRRLDL